MMHGYIDSFPVPLHLPTSHTSAPAKASKSAKGKGKEKDDGAGAGQPGAGMYDVVANWTAAERDAVERKVAMAALLGYSTVILTLSIPPTTNPSVLSFPTPLFPELDPRTAKPGTEGLVLQLWRMEVVDLTEEAIKSNAVKGYYGLCNATVPLFPSSVSLLSVVPASLPVFSHVSLSLSPPSGYSPSYITIDPSLSPRLPFPLKRGLINTLLRAGCMFEIVLRGMVRQDDVPTAGGGSTAGGGAGQRRRNWIAGAREIVRATGGTQIVISSGAMKAGEMRGSEDIINLCTLIGLTPPQAKDALTTNPQKAILRGLALKQTYRGVISNPTVTIVSKAAFDPTSPRSVLPPTTEPATGKKRTLDDAASPIPVGASTALEGVGGGGAENGGGKKKKKRKGEE